MRRKLAVASVVSFVVAFAGLATLLFIGGPLAAPAGFPLALAVTILAFVAAVMTGVFGIILPIFGVTPRRADLTDAAAAGREGLARVLSVTPTGAQINGRWVYDADLVVDQTRVPAYRTSDRIRVHRDDGLLRGGEIISVVRLRDEAPDVSVLRGPRRSPQDALVPLDAPPWA
ncbi:MAG TPA: hypothetical protein VNR36_05430 [Pseudolysinimonas sp.]|nr:hypothetical protein [Pseudolysinimonas sp.]